MNPVRNKSNGMKEGISNGMKIIQKPINFLKEVRVELGKVAWSSRQELIDSTAVVIVTTAILSLFIGIIDIILSKFLSLMFK